MSNTFDSTCGHPGCDRPIRSYNGGASWRHLPQPGSPAAGHHAYAHGVMIQR